MDNMGNKHRLYLKVKEDKLSVESFVVLFVLNHCQLENVDLVLVNSDEITHNEDEIVKKFTELSVRSGNLTNGGSLNLSDVSVVTGNEFENAKIESSVVTLSEAGISYVSVNPEVLGLLRIISLKSEEYQKVNFVSLPALVSSDETLVIIGICGIIRFLLKNLDEVNLAKNLLGFRHSCLCAPAEVSVWTRFCEVETIEALKNFRKEVFPTIFPKLENHLNQPVRMHNVMKKVLSEKKIEAKENAESEKKERENGSGIFTKVNSEIGNMGLKKLQNRAGTLLDHKFAEGSQMTLADLVLFPSFLVLLRYYDKAVFKKEFPAVSRWYTCVEQLCKDTLNITVSMPFSAYEFRPTVPEVSKGSLYARDPTRCDKNGTDQSELDKVFLKLQNENFEYDKFSLATDDYFDWSSLPPEAHPTGGNLPESRVLRKCEQLQNIIVALKKIVKPNDVIVDFCSGGGHLGIVLAYLLPKAQIVLIDNKSESVSRARDRVLKLGLSNIRLIQGNINYFTGEFSVGVSLHACGSATDIVLRACLSRKARFIISPCCYGAIQSSSAISYPQSNRMEKVLTTSEFNVLAHSADQTHDALNKKTEQGFKCMDLADTDRAMLAAQFGYHVCLTKLKPETCSPKNNLLVGIPK